MPVNARSLRVILAAIAALVLLQARVVLADCSAADEAVAAAFDTCCRAPATAISDTDAPAQPGCGNPCLQPSPRCELHAAIFSPPVETPPSPSQSDNEHDWDRTDRSASPPLAALRADGWRILYDLQRLLI